MINLRHALRTLLKTPFVTVVAIVSLALGIGANAGMFSIFNQVILRPLPVPQPDRLVNLGAPGPKLGSTSCNSAGPCEDVFSYPMFRDLERLQTSFTGIAAHVLFSANLAYSRADHQRVGRPRVRQLLPGARRQAGARPAPESRRRRGGW